MDSYIYLSGQTCSGAEEKRICEIQQKILQHPEGIFQGGSACDRVHLGHLPDPPDQHGHDHRQGQVRVDPRQIDYHCYFIM